MLVRWSMGCVRRFVLAERSCDRRFCWPVADWTRGILEMNFLDSSFDWPVVGAWGGFVGLWAGPRLLLLTRGFFTGSGLAGFTGLAVFVLVSLNTLLTCSVA